MYKPKSDTQSSLRCLLGLILSLSLITSVQAETIYINDELRVGVRPEPDNDSAPLTVVSTGDKLELIDTTSGYVKVRTREGVEGWIKSIYTTQEMPAVLQLQELTRNAGGVSRKLKELNEQVSIMKNANHALTTELEQLKNEKEQMQIQLIGLKNGHPTGHWTAWLYWIVGSLLFILLSFLCGMYWYRHQAMKRLGGLRIYF